MRNFFIGLFIGGLIGLFIILGFSNYIIDRMSYLISVGVTTGSLLVGLFGSLVYYTAPEHFKKLVLKRKQNEAKRKTKKQKQE